MQNSNADHVQAWLENWLTGVNFKRVGADQSLGRDIARRIVERIHDRSLEDKAGIDGEWDANAPAYAAYKEKRYGIVDQPNVRTGQMLDKISLFGRTRIEEKEITMVYGINAPPGQTTTGAPLSESDKKVTDVQKAYFAHRGSGSSRNSKGQFAAKKIRPFYQVDESDAAEVVKLAQANINEYIEKTNRDNGY
jgi:hypothetical protein